MSTTKKKTTEEFIIDANLIHNNKYDYSKVEYVNSITKVCIICPEHGEFWQTPKIHLQNKGCPVCGKYKTRKKSNHSYSTNLKYTLEKFLDLSKERYGDKYDYSKVEYVNMKTKVCIICPEHGEFWQRPIDHLNGCGCKKCISDIKRKLFASNNIKFIDKANKVFNNLFTYDNVEYVNNSTKVSITCNKHGDFLCTPANHLRGRGCPICSAEKYVYEERLYNCLLTIFNKNDIIRQYKAEWLTNKKSIDFFISKYNIAIEHQGSQHFKPINYFGGVKKYSRIVELDKEKFEECKKNGVNILYFSYEKYNMPIDYFCKIYDDENDLINKIKNIINKDE